MPHRYIEQELHGVTSTRGTPANRAESVLRRRTVDEELPAPFLTNRLQQICDGAVRDEPPHAHEVRLARVVRSHEHGDGLDRDGLKLAEALEVLERDRLNHGAQRSPVPSTRPHPSRVEDRTPEVRKMPVVEEPSPRMDPGSSGCRTLAPASA